MVEIVNCEQKELMDSYKNKSGVWFLIGKLLNEKSYICLQVGQSKDIGNEIIRDSGYLSGVDPYEKVCKTYVNQFGELQFKYYDYPDLKGKKLYNNIAENYKDFLFICISEIDNRDTRLALEKYIAYKTESKYWRNGRPLSPQEKNFINDRKKYLKKCCGALRKEITEIISENYIKDIDLILEEIINNNVKEKQTLEKLLHQNKQ